MTTVSDATHSTAMTAAESDNAGAAKEGDTRTPISAIHVQHERQMFVYEKAIASSAEPAGICRTLSDLLAKPRSLHQTAAAVQPAREMLRGYAGVAEWNSLGGEYTNEPEICCVMSSPSIPHPRRRSLG